VTAIETDLRIRENADRPTVVDWKSTCLNCGATLGGSFCSECGQRAAPPHPSLRELGGEAFAELSGWDGKIAETVRTLIRKPGQLTIEFLEGRRARYLSPLRLYLWCSVIYFLVAASTPTNMRSSIVITPPDPTTGAATRRNIADAEKNAGLTAEERAQIAQMVNNAPSVLRPLMRRVSTDAKSFQNDVFASMPKALFALLPVFAGILTLFYRKRRFAEHLYFALHVHAFIFIALTFAAVVKLAHVKPLEVAVGIAVLVWLPIYAHLSFRRVYGGSHAALLLKEIGIGALYVAASIPTVVLLAIWVASR
jgi:hypothetical protein